jgi:hypothetical protein
MKNQSSGSKGLKVTSVILFTMGGISALTLLAGVNYLSIMAAALFTLAGGAMLVINAIKNPSSISIPDVPEVKIPTVRVEYKTRG